MLEGDFQPVSQASKKFSSRISLNLATSIFHSTQTSFFFWYWWKNLPTAWGFTLGSGLDHPAPLNRLHNPKHSMHPVVNLRYQGCLASYKEVVNWCVGEGSIYEVNIHSRLYLGPHAGLLYVFISAKHTTNRWMALLFQNEIFLAFWY